MNIWYTIISFKRGDRTKLVKNNKKRNGGLHFPFIVGSKADIFARFPLPPPLPGDLINEHTCTGRVMNEVSTMVGILASGSGPDASRFERISLSTQSPDARGSWRACNFDYLVSGPRLSFRWLTKPCTSLVSKSQG